MPKVRILEEYCKGCQLCVLVCPKKTLALSSRVNKRGMQVVAVLESDGCTGCGSCVLMCPDAAIEISEETTDHPQTRAKPKSTLKFSFQSKGGAYGQAGE